MIKTVSFSDNNVIHTIDIHSDIQSDMKSDTYKENIHNNDKECDKECSEKEETKTKIDKVYTKYTKFCLFGLGNCKKGFKCVYAHTFKELNPITCKWDEECLRKEKCYFKHSNETKTQYVKRAFSEDINRLNISLFDEQPKISQDIKIDKENTEEIIEEDNFDKEAFIKGLRDLRTMYYDPIVDVRCWGDIPDSDEDEPYPYF